MPDTPICLLVDGERVPHDLVKAYGVRIIRRSEVEHAELREWSFGGLRAKNAVHWLAPFETFLSLDADAVVWGDMRTLCDFERFDFVLDTPIPNPGYVRGWVMDVEEVGRQLPGIDAQRYAPLYVNSGAYFARKGVLELDRYLELLRFSAEHPGLFRGSQGIFNFMVFSGVDEGRLRLDQRELQVTTGDVAREEVVRRFLLIGGEPRVVDGPLVLHWAGSAKPRLRQRGRDYFEPMTFFRRRFRVDLQAQGGVRARDELRLRIEDVLCADFRGSNLRGRVNMARRRMRKRYAHARVAVRSRTPDWGHADGAAARLCEP